MIDDFIQTSQTLHSRWTQTCLGTGALTLEDSVLRMAIPAVAQGTYADAQIDDYGTLARSDFPWHPPLRMEVRARSSHPAATPASTSRDPHLLRGTAGFGFWNYPFSVRGDILMLPEAVWFFYASPPSNMALVPGIPGWGWKAQVIHSMRPGSLLATLPTALATGWGLTTGNTRPAGRWLQRLSGAQEQLLSVPMTIWHTYVIEWTPEAALFWVDGEPVLRAPNPPTRPLGFVAWLDNQYAIATPRGILRFGTVACDDEWFEIDSIHIERH
ncbi:family 16 glycosylhydrolase [Ktedonobacter racemifer]|uniref:GH16 domain-containing protein n=1 Tax=Ktedonobacter racemifer DSM 44963 TaxID=485913 RepID=D6U6X4_KTERA|nr:family 16 glycosylhydrolase [Ktedonobacter racemifer]EFH80735.1 conserved hypothetical protein [Ktedonobacter racemifer DSM 44963]